MARLGRIVASLPMSLVTLNQAPLLVRDALAIAISQSGRVRMWWSRSAISRRRGEHGGAGQPGRFATGQAAQWSLPLHAGVEASVAATKSFIASLVAGALLTAHWQDDAALLDALGQLPQALRQRANPTGQRRSKPWSRPIASWWWGAASASAGAGGRAQMQGNLRHPGRGLQRRRDQARADGLIEEGYPLLMFATRGPSQAGMLALAAEMRARGARSCWRPPGM
jgi:glucosamine--fructose-6-phosphate aminotransferase (isomerizing)